MQSFLTASTVEASAEVKKSHKASRSIHLEVKIAGHQILEMTFKHPDTPATRTARHPRKGSKDPSIGFSGLTWRYWLHAPWGLTYVENEQQLAARRKLRTPETGWAVTEPQPHEQRFGYSSTKM